MMFKKISSCILLPLLFLSCATQKASMRSASDADIYQQAIVNSMSPEPSKIYGDLLPITKENKNLVWKTIDGEDYLLMVTWKQTVKYYQPICTDKPCYNTGAYQVWVTAAPELRRRFIETGSKDTAMRLKQLLGLPPNAEYSYFVEFWVRPQDLFRPCPDNEITDKTCSLCFSAGADSSYIQWVNDNRISRYYPCALYDKYPWTQLGYTYDWNPKNKSHVGLSEFVIGANKNIAINGVYTTSEYLNRK